MTRNPETLDEFIKVAERILAEPDVISFAKAPGTDWGGPIFLLHFLTAVAKQVQDWHESLNEDWGSSQSWPPPGADDA